MLGFAGGRGDEWVQLGSRQKDMVPVAWARRKVEDHHNVKVERLPGFFPI